MVFFFFFEEWFVYYIYITQHVHATYEFQINILR